MPDASTTGETQSQTGTTAARQMLAALTRHSQEITKRFSDSCEYLSRLNSTLENKVNGRLADINEAAEQIVRVQLENLSAEKDSVLAELTELRQEELKVLQTIGRDLRDALNERLKELVTKLKAELGEKLTLFQDNLLETETEVSLAVSNLRNGLDEKLPERLVSIQNEGSSVKKELENTQSKQKELLNQEASLSLDTLALNCDELKGQLEKEGSDYLGSIDKLIERLLEEQTDKLKQSVKALSTLQERAGQQIQADLNDIEKSLASFGVSCEQISHLRLNLHTSMAKNLALIYRTELLSIAQETEDQLIIVRSHLHSVLRNYHDYYSEQANKLLSKFEQGAKQAMPVQTAQENSELEEIPAEVKELFAKLKLEVNDAVKEIIAKADKQMENSLADFRLRLTESSQKVASLAENKFNEFRNEVSAAVTANNAKLDELSQKAEALEQLVDESKELISALDQTNLEF